MKYTNSQNENDYHEEQEEVGKMDYTTTGKVLTTLDSYGGGYGYGGVSGTSIGNGFLGYQNMRINDNVKDGFCATSAVVREEGRHADVVRGQVNLEIDNKIDRQSALFTSQHAGIHDQVNMNSVKLAEIALSTQKEIADSKLYTAEKFAQLEKSNYERELRNNQTATILDGQKINRLEAKVSSFCCPSPISISSPVTCDTFK